MIFMLKHSKTLMKETKKTFVERQTVTIRSIDSMNPIPGFKIPAGLFW